MPSTELTQDEAATLLAVCQALERGEAVRHKGGKLYRLPSWANGRAVVRGSKTVVWLVGDRGGKPFGPVRPLAFDTLAPCAVQS